jgi:hypothetical protein
MQVSITSVSKKTALQLNAGVRRLPKQPVSRPPRCILPATAAATFLLTACALGTGRSAPRIAESRGALSGLVVSARSDSGVEGASVRLASVDDTTRVEAGALSEVSGAFRLVPPRAGRYWLTVRRIGYQGIGRPVEIRAHEETQIRLELPEVARSAVCTGWVMNALEVEPVDASTGANVAPGARLWVRDGDYRDSSALSLNYEPEPGLVLGAAPDRPGRYHVRLEVPGYAPWERSRVRAGERTDCGIRPTRLRAKLRAAASSPR